MQPIHTHWQMFVWILFAVSVMIYGWAVLFWQSLKRRQFSLLSLFVLTLFVAIGVGIPLILLRFPTIEMR
jgi:hypothetical protein